VTQFYDKVSEVLSRHHLGASKIWNMDETGITTLLKPKITVAGRGVKKVLTVISAERGEPIIVTAEVSAQGTFIPLLLIFPCKIFVITSYELAPQLVLEVPRDLVGLMKRTLSSSLNTSFAILNPPKTTLYCSSWTTLSGT
jgi:hypothetical protein